MKVEGEMFFAHDRRIRDLTRAIRDGTTSHSEAVMAYETFSFILKPPSSFPYPLKKAS